MRILRILRANRRNRTLLALGTVILMYTFATGVMQYNLALFSDDISANYTIFGVVMGLPWLFSLLTDMPAGALAERVGKKRMIVIGLGGLAASGALFYFVSGVFQLFWVLVFFGTFEGFLTVAGMSAVIAVSPRGSEHRFVGGYTSASALGYTLGPLAGGLAVAWWGDRLPFLVFGAICLLAMFTAMAIIPGPRHEHDPVAQALRKVFTHDRVYLAGLREFFASGRVSWLIGSAVLLTGMWSEFIWAVEPVFADRLGLPPLMGGLVLAAFVVPFTLLDFPIGVWIDRTRQRFAAILTGLILGGIAMILFGLARSPLALVLLAALVSAAYALFYVAVNGVFDSLSDWHRRGHVTGVWQAAEDVGFVLGPIAGGVVADFFGLSGAFVAFGLLFLLVSLVVGGMRKDIHRYESHAA